MPSPASCAPVGRRSPRVTSCRGAWPASPTPRVASLRYPLAAVAALLADHEAVLGNAEWGARQDPSRLTPRGFPTAETPCQSTFQRLYRRLDGAALVTAQTAHVAPAALPTGGLQGVAVDGKAQRGRRRFAAAGCPVHALSACCLGLGPVLAQEPITGDGDRDEAALSVAPALLQRFDGRHQGSRAMRSSANAAPAARFGRRVAMTCWPSRRTSRPRTSRSPGSALPARLHSLADARSVRGADGESQSRPPRRTTAAGHLHRPDDIPP